MNPKVKSTDEVAGQLGARPRGAGMARQVRAPAGAPPAHDPPATSAPAPPAPAASTAPVGGARGRAPVTAPRRRSTRRLKEGRRDGRLLKDGLSLIRAHLGGAADWVDDQADELVWTRRS